MVRNQGGTIGDGGASVMDGPPKPNRCPHGRDSAAPNQPTDTCPDCTSRKCPHGRYNMDDFGHPKITCPECSEVQAQLAVGVFISKRRNMIGLTLRIDPKLDHYRSPSLGSSAPSPPDLA